MAFVTRADGEVEQPVSVGLSNQRPHRSSPMLRKTIIAVAFTLPLASLPSHARDADPVLEHAWECPVGRTTINCPVLTNEPPPQVQTQVSQCAQLLPVYAQRVHAANPSMPGHVKMHAVEKMMAMVGCGQQPAPSQKMLCIDM